MSNVNVREILYTFAYNVLPKEKNLLVFEPQGSKKPQANTAATHLSLMGILRLFHFFAEVKKIHSVMLEETCQREFLLLCAFLIQASRE